MNGIDIFLFIILLIGTVTGFVHGIIFEVAGVLGTMLAIYLARYHADYFAGVFSSYFDMDSSILPLIGMAIAFVFGLFIVRVLAMVANRFIKAIKLDWLNKIGGAFLGFLKYALVLSVVVNLIVPINDKLDVIKSETLQKSVLFSPVKAISGKILPFLNMNGLHKLLG